MSLLPIVSLLLCLFCYLPALVHAEPVYDSSELTSGYLTVVDETGSVILQTGLAIRPGDQFINEKNRLYEIVAVEGNLARGRYLRDEKDIAAESLVTPAQTAQESSPPIIGIYHTHTDECYIPTDGKPTDPGNGSIMLVGAQFANRLNELGYQPIHDKTLHEPHDANAYQRSRRTFMKLLEQQPVALFDLHRDSAPLNLYQTTINEKDASKILLVVGRQNQNRNTTLGYAKSIKASADTKYKGLIRGIFIAHGNYNQDLSPRAMLVEIGTQYNTLEAAQYSAVLFADLVPSFLAPAGPNAAAESAVTDGYDMPQSYNYAYDLFLILGTLMIGILAYLYLSTGSWQEATRKLEKFRKFEFLNFMGSRKKRRD